MSGGASLDIVVEPLEPGRHHAEFTRVATHLANRLGIVRTLDLRTGTATFEALETNDATTFDADAQRLQQRFGPRFSSLHHRRRYGVALSR
ncbi:MAG: hypothetical protein HC809_04100 [Gammaproteobacteria bacterium]|nr:hypothetical protein [Gammaproteobacteria bacterium]